MTGAAETERAKPAWLAGAAFACVVGYVLFVDLDGTPYDDSFFFKRVALKFLHGFGLSWNAADGPVYGLTSQLFGLVTLALTWLFPSHVVLASKCFLALALAAFGALLLRVAARSNVLPRDAALLVFLALGTPLTLLGPHSGMESCLCLAVLALALVHLANEDAARPRSLGAALATVLVYTCRPDAALIPAVAFVLAERRDLRRVLSYAAWLGVLLGALLCAFHFYYGTALPLPFYAKTAGLSSYDRELRAAGFHGKVQHLLTFAAFTAPLAWVALRGRHPRSLAWLGSAVCFVAYQACVTNEIMGYRGRFYLAALAPLALAAITGWPQFLARARLRTAGTAWLAWATLVALAYGAGLVARGGDSALERVPASAYVVQLFLGVLLLGRVSGSERLGARMGEYASFGLLSLGALLLRPPRLPHAALDDDAFLHRASADVTTTRGLFEIARCLPGGHTLYHSEIGIPGLALPDWRVVDLVGLMSKELARKRPPFDDYCLRDRPEALFLPHKAYRALNAEIRASACLRGYALEVRDSSSPLYVRRDLSAAFSACRRDAWRAE